MNNPTVNSLEGVLALRRKRFLAWLKKNPDVWTEFVSMSFEAIGNGRKHYSAWLIAAVIRHRHDIKASDGEFKISNERIGWLARFFHHKYPEYKDFYATRLMKEERLLTELKSRSNVVHLSLRGDREG